MISKNRLKKKLFIIDSDNYEKFFTKIIKKKVDEQSLIIFFGDDFNKIKIKVHGLNLNIKVVNATGYLERYALKVREIYKNIVGQSHKINLNKKKQDLKNFLKYKDFSLWWLSEIFHKRSYTYSTISYLSKIELINDILNQNKIKNVYLDKNDNTLNYLVNSLCEKKNILCDSKNLRANFYKNIFFPIYAIVNYTIFTIKLIIFTFFIKIFNNDKLNKNKITFVQFIKNVSKNNSNIFAEKFGENNQIARKFKKEAVNIYSLIPDGFHPTIKFNMIKAFFKEKKPTSVYNNNIDIHLSYKQILQIYLEGITVIFKFNFLLNSYSYKDHWKYLGIDIFPLIYYEHIQCMIRVPRYLYYIKKLINYFSLSKPKVLLYNMFELAIGKATVYACQHASPSTAIIACQEGPLSKLKMESSNLKYDFFNIKSKNKNYIRSMPSPDYLFVEGNYYKNIMSVSGFPSDKIFLVGAPRLMHLEKVIDFDHNFHNKKILVTLGANDGDIILKRCINIYQKKNDLKFIIKLHPRGNLNIRQIKNILNKNNISKNFQVTNRPFMKLLPIASCVIGTFSSTLIESAVKGYPTILFLFSSQINTSSLIDIKYSNIFLCKSSEEFINIIEDIYKKFPKRKHYGLSNLFFYNRNKNVEKMWYNNINKIYNLSIKRK